MPQFRNFRRRYQGALPNDFYESSCLRCWLLLSRRRREPSVPRKSANKIASPHFRAPVGEKYAKVDRTSPKLVDSDGTRGAAPVVGDSFGNQIRLAFFERRTTNAIQCVRRTALATLFSSLLEKTLQIGQDQAASLILRRYEAIGVYA